MAQVRIFVSHSSHDNAWSRPFADALKAVGYDVWYDETGLQGGAAWVASIQHEVETRDVFLLVLTPEAWESKWVQDELQLAIATRRRILPVLLRNTQVSGFLLTTQWITVIGEQPQAAARAAIMAIEAPPAPGRNAAPQATTETLDELVTLCRSLLTEKRYTEALSASGRALALDPANIEVLSLRGWALQTIQEPQKAVETWERALSLAHDEGLVQVANDVLTWIEEDLMQKHPGGISDADIVGALTPLVSQLMSGHALYEVLYAECFSASVHLMYMHYQLISELAAKGRDSDVLRVAVDIAMNANMPEWATQTQEQGLVNPYLGFVVSLIEGCYGYPPDKATSVDVGRLSYYKDALVELGRQEESAVVRQYIQRLLPQR